MEVGQQFYLRTGKKGRPPLVTLKNKYQNGSVLVVRSDGSTVRVRPKQLVEVL